MMHTAESKVACVICSFVALLHKTFCILLDGDFLIFSVRLSANVDQVWDRGCLSALQCHCKEKLHVDHVVNFIVLLCEN